MKRTKRRLHINRQTIRRLTHAEQAAIIGGYRDSGAAACPAVAACPTDSMTTR